MLSRRDDARDGEAARRNNCGEGVDKIYYDEGLDPEPVEREHPNPRRTMSAGVEPAPE